MHGMKLLMLLVWLLHATQQWILQRLHHKPNVDLKGFLFMKKTKISFIMTKNVRFFITVIFFHEPVVKQGHYMTLLLSYANTVL